MRFTLSAPRRFALASGVAALLAPLAPLAHAATPGIDGPVVFMRFAGAREDDRTAQLVVRTPAGVERQITHLSGGAFAPDWSPDGARIVFEHWDARHRGPDQLTTVAADGSDLRLLTTSCTKAAGCLTDDHPAWSPDGTRIAFVRYRLPEVKVAGESVPSAADLMIVPAIGGDPQVLRHFDGDPLPDQPSWSPDGTRLVFPLTTTQHPTKQTPFLNALNVLDLASGNLTAITPLSLGAAEPDWSPDGTRILFNSDAGHSPYAYVVRPDGSGLRKIVHKARNTSRFASDPRMVESITLRPRWTPDGKRITFTGEPKACSSRHLGGCREPATPTVFVMNPDGSGVHALAKARGRAQMAPSVAPAP